MVDSTAEGGVRAPWSMFVQSVSHADRPGKGTRLGAGRSVAHQASLPFTFGGEALVDGGGAFVNDVVVLGGAACAAAACLGRVELAVSTGQLSSIELLLLQRSSLPIWSRRIMLAGQTAQRRASCQQCVASCSVPFRPPLSRPPSFVASFAPCDGGQPRQSGGGEQRSGTCVHQVTQESSSGCRETIVLALHSVIASQPDLESSE